jgi:hypothetical protein
MLMVESSMRMVLSTTSGSCLEKRTHYYVRHGTTSLFAAMNVEDGTVIASTHRRHRATELKKFLAKIDSQGRGTLVGVVVGARRSGGLRVPSVGWWSRVSPVGSGVELGGRPERAARIDRTHSAGAAERVLNLSHELATTAA